MARARSIKPGFFKNEVLGVADPLLSLLFEGLWSLADREGRLEDRPLRIKAEIFPYRNLDVDPMLDWLQENSFIVRYLVGGIRYIAVTNFVKHQNPHKNETESIFPGPDQSDAKPEKIGSTTEKIGSTRADCLYSDSLTPDSLTPDSCSLTPDCLNGFPGSALQTVSPAVASDLPVAPKKRAKKVETEKTPAPTAFVWQAYAEAYERRYGALPVRNAKVNGLLAQFVQRIPHEEAPGVARHYLASNKGWYVSKGHCVDCMLKDAENLRTEWVTQRHTTDTQARQADQTASNGFAIIARKMRKAQNA